MSYCLHIDQQFEPHFFVISVPGGKSKMKNLSLITSDQIQYSLVDGVISACNQMTLCYEIIL